MAGNTELVELSAELQDRLRHFKVAFTLHACSQLPQSLLQIA